MAGRQGALALCFLLSGAGALVAETVWLRWLRELLGATAPAASATLLAFFAGHALGAILAFVWAARSGQFDDLDSPGLRMLNEDDDELSVGTERGASKRDASSTE